MNLTDLLAALPPELRAYISDLENRALHWQQRATLLEDQFRLALLKRYAPSSEKAIGQACLFNEAEQEAVVAETEEDDTSSDKPKAESKKRGRKALPPHLPRKRIEYDLPEDKKICACCSGTLHLMGEETSEQLDFIPAKVQVLQHVRFKYGCRQCDRHGESSKIVVGAMPAQPIPGSNASAGTIATVLTAKYADGMPLYRQHAALLRSDVDVARGTLAQWCIKAGVLFTPLYAALRQELLSQGFIHGDETTVQVLKEDGRRAQSQSYMWVYRSAEQSDRPVVLFEYQPGRGHQHPQQFLDGYTGTLMTDGYSAWRMLAGIKHLGCMAHVRRRFDEALKAQKNPSGRAKEALDMIGKLYHIESAARKQSPSDGLTELERIYQWRQEKSRPILDQFHAWLIKNQSEVLPQSLLGKAIHYALGQWLYLYRYLDDARNPIDNNLIERDIRPFATARKAWLFSHSVPGADASAVIYSLMLTCRACNIEPYAYLRHVLTELPQRPTGSDITDLLPFNFIAR